MSNVNLSMFRNNDWSADIVVTLNGTALNITGGTLRMTAKYKLDVTDADATFTVFKIFSPSNGITITDAVNGKATLNIAGSLTSALPATRINLFYDVQLTDSGSKKYTIMSGILTVNSDVSLTTP